MRSHHLNDIFDKSTNLKLSYLTDFLKLNNSLISLNINSNNNYFFDSKKFGE